MNKRTECCECGDAKGWFVVPDQYTGEASQQQCRTCDEYNLLEAELNRVTQENKELSTLLNNKIDAINIPCSHALDELWDKVILKRKPNYGPWEYPMQAVRHILAEIEEIKLEARLEVQG